MDNDISAKTTWVDLGGLIYVWGGGGGVGPGYVLFNNNPSSNFVGTRGN